MSVRLNDALEVVNNKWQKSPDLLIINEEKLISRFPELDVIEQVRGIQREIYFDKRTKKLLENITYVSHNRKYHLLNEHHFRALFHINMHCNPERITINGLVKVKSGRIYMRQNMQGMARRMKMSVEGARKALKLLQHLDIIFAKQLDPDPTNKTNYYTINYEKLFELAGTNFSIMHPNLPTMEAFVDKPPKDALHAVKVTAHIECNINENNILKNITKEEEQNVDKVPITQLRFAPKTNFFGKIIKFIHNKFDNYSFPMDTKPKVKPEYVDYSGSKFKSNDFKPTDVSYIAEKEHPEESELCQSLRHRLKAFLGKPAYVSWFNDVELVYTIINNRSELIVYVNTNFIHDYFKNNYLNTIRRFADNLAIHTVRLVIKATENRAESGFLEGKLDGNVESTEKAKVPTEIAAKPN